MGTSGVCCQQEGKKRRFFFHKFNSFNYDNAVWYLFYSSIIQSVISFCIIAWSGNTSAKNKFKINHGIKRAGKISQTTLLFCGCLFESLCLKSIQRNENSGHPLAHQIRSSARSHMPLYLLTKTERHKRSFLPYAITLLGFNR